MPEQRHPEPESCPGPRSAKGSGLRREVIGRPLYRHLAVVLYLIGGLRGLAGSSISRSGDARWSRRQVLACFLMHSDHAVRLGSA